MPVQVRETMKPGETIEGRDNRFSSWGDSVGYYRKPSATMTSAYKTDSRLNSLIDPDHARLDVAICERIRTMHTRSSGASSNNIDEEIASSTRTSTFRDHFHSHKEIISSKERDPDDFRDCFDKYSSTGTATVPTITLDLVPKVVVGCLGLDTPHYIIDKFAKLAAGAIHERYLSWSDFRRLVPKVYQALRAECTSQKSGDSGLLMLMNKPPLADKDLGPFGDLSSTYRDNFRAPDEHSAESPVSHLHAGTTRGTLQLPGYMGHLPRNTKNPRKAGHSDGSITRPVANCLMLTQRGTGCAVLGYGGYIPVTPGDYGQRTTACDPRTTTGAAYGETRRML